MGDFPDETGNLDSIPYYLVGFGSQLATFLEVSPFDIVYHDLAVHPVTKAAFISISGKGDGEDLSALVMVSPQGEITKVDEDMLRFTSIDISEPADPDITFWRDIPAPALSVTDFEYDDGTLYVAGLSTGEFASTLRSVEYPFQDGVETTSIEMFHTAHNQNETRAPIRAMAVVDIDGTSTAVAAYTCTPLVTIPVADLADGAHVTGKTIAELGYGNTPLDVISFSAANFQGEVSNYVLVVNREMDADLITLENLTAAAAGPGIAEPVPYLGATSGVQTVPLPLSGVVHMADQDGQFLLALRRDLDTGAMELVSFRKGSFLRMSDFIREYNFPDYAYADDEMSTGVRMFQNMLKADEGFPGQIRQ